MGATTIAWTGIVSSRPPTISVSFLPDSFTRRIIVESREFVVNVPSANFYREANYLGSLTGPWDLKMEGMRRTLGSSLSLENSQHINSPRVREFYLNLECRLMSVIQIGLYDCFIGQVLAMACDEAVYKDNHPKGNVDYSILSPLFCLSDEYWSSGQKLGTSTENKDHPHGSEH